LLAKLYIFLNHRISTILGTADPWYDFDAITDPEILEQHVQWYVDISQKHRPHIPIEQVNERASFFEKIRLLWPKKFANSLKLWARQLMPSIEFTARAQNPTAS
jgi:hypothetical protein